SSRGGGGGGTHLPPDRDRPRVPLPVGIASSGFRFRVGLRGRPRPLGGTPDGGAPVSFLTVEAPMGRFETGLPVWPFLAAGALLLPAPAGGQLAESSDRWLPWIGCWEGTAALAEAGEEE